MVELFRNLKSKAIVCSTLVCNEQGVYLQLSKNTSCDMKILDETVGPQCWQRKYEEVAGYLFCGVGIYYGGTWVWKQDTGKKGSVQEKTPLPTQCFMQACRNWGIGRELDTAPEIWIPKPDVGLVKTGSRYTTRDHFTVEHIIVEGGRIAALSIRNETLNRRVFWLDNRKENTWTG